MELDRISNLPSNVTQQILSYLPIKDAGKTSMLSKDWRFKWAMLPSLVFDHEIDDVDSVDHVLLLHPGPIFSFKLSAQNIMDKSAINRWIRHLSRQPIRQFILKGCYNFYSNRRPYDVSSSLFSCQDLTHLELSDCSLRLPWTFNGFRMLRTLNIKRVTVARDELEKMIVCSPLLERLTLRDLQGITRLKIHAPNLQFLKVRGDFEDVELTNTLNLVHVSLDRNRAHWRGDRLLNSCVKLPYIKRLTIEGCILESATGSLPKELRRPCLYLNFLSINIRLNNLEEISTVMCLLRSSPALQELEISVRQQYEEATTAREATPWLNDNQNWEFSKLQRVKVTGFSGAQAEVDFIKFLFLSSPALQELEVSVYQKDETVVGEVDYSWLNNDQNFAHTQLRLLKVTDFCGEVEFIKFLLLSSPALQELHILFRENDHKNKIRNKWLDDAAMGDEDNRNCTFTQLRVMNISGFFGAKAEVGFIRFLLTSSPMLERITLQPASAKVPWEVSKLLNEFKSNSVHTNLKLLDPLNPSADYHSRGSRCRTPLCSDYSCYD
ncbi:putative F-box domain, FBD domain, leucine-rich repeat domain, L domain-containing protein [Rosa chinensis]|uniref:Putative F-box domain, FBD domain, leucine-rich repeat domain, L domain-containing protein n=1 Tax=Rosa chinensis TaxID=74649 RepID=A0A2P6QET5_ROSCH|nr:F-box/FBD/LRR-repeat protein At1g13570 [Rosa chinensis]PRQ32693.1 putative F-box domain, FBD domain, leucine-rich repeat domain, L domain-containing protein [Rosa chinensis]